MQKKIINEIFRPKQRKGGSMPLSANMKKLSGQKNSQFVFIKKIRHHWNKRDI